MQACTTPTAPPISPALDARYHVANHREEWAAVVPGLEEMEKMNSQRDWSIKTIRDMLDDGTALLLVDDDDPSAFAVVRFDSYPYSIGDTELYVFLVWHQGGDAIEKFEPHFQAFARIGGAKYIRFFSRRPAWLRVAPRVGYHVGGVEYVKELHHGR